jgi:hypothetical protein
MRPKFVGLPARTAIMRPKQKAEEDDICVRALPSNVVPFPRVRRDIPTAIPEPRRAKQPAAIAPAQLNARLLLLLGICTMSATSVLLAVHLLYG